VNDQDPILTAIAKLSFDIRTALERDIARFHQSVSDREFHNSRSIESTLSSFGDTVLSRINRALKVTADLRDLDHAVASILRRLDAIEKQLSDKGAS
jgi:hypothetical protein